MKRPRIILFITLSALAMLLAARFLLPTGSEPWSEKQLMDPAELAARLEGPDRPLVLSIGFGGGIRHSGEMGPAREKEGLGNLKNKLEKLPKDAEIVIYCGCCPFRDCPNIRPAFSLLNEMGFTNHKLLNLPSNLKTDWIDKGYPFNESKP